MFPQKNRLHLKKDFENVFKKGRSFFLPFCQIIFIKNEIGYLRIAFVVSKKVSKKAVQRHKIQRVAREAMRKVIGNTIYPYDMIVIFKKEGININYSELCNSFSFFIKKNIS